MTITTLTSGSLPLLPVPAGVLWWLQSPVSATEGEELCGTQGAHLVSLHDTASQLLTHTLCSAASGNFSRSTSVQRPWRNCALLETFVFVFVFWLLLLLLWLLLCAHAYEYMCVCVCVCVGVCTYVCMCVYVYM